MSPDALKPHREALDVAYARLGWSRHEVERFHEYKWNCSWTENVVRGPAGEYLMLESALTEGLIRELIRVAKSLG